MNDLQSLPDEELLARARQWRTQALRGALHARGYAHEYEAEVRRRFRSRPAPAAAAPAELEAAPSRWPFGRFWRQWLRTSADRA
jgi:hypothetical protein